MMNAPAKTEFPHFVPNQILTNTQLNQLREYLDEQDRLTRIRLVGAGIVCGLDVGIDANVVTVSGGYGVTSDGYLIAVEDLALTHVRDYVDPDVEESEDAEEAKTPRYELWQKPGDIAGQIDLQELVNEDMLADAPPSSPPATALSTAALADRVVVLYLERQEVDLKSCLVTDCNNKGLNVSYFVRVLLVPKSELTAIPDCPPPPKTIRVPRLHTVVDLAGVDSGEKIDEGYLRLVQDAAQPLAEAIRAAFERYGAFLHLDAPDLSSIESFTSLTNANQYTYDALTDVACAYNEAVTEACDLLRDCCPERDFPRHLMLEAMSPPGRYRNDFIASPVRNVMHGDLERVRLLFDRIRALVESIDGGISTRQGIRVTPSHTAVAPLGERAVPYYFDLSTVERTWQPLLCCTTDTLWTYDRQEATQDVDTDYRHLSLMRIEGHLGLPCDEAYSKIADLRTSRNLEFDVLRLHLKDPAAPEETNRKTLDSFVRFLRTNSVELRARFRDVLRREVPPEDLLELVDKRADLLRGLSSAWLDWANDRSRRELLCDASALRADYLAARSEYLCALHGILGMIDKLPTLERLFEDLAKPIREIKRRIRVGQSIDGLSERLRELSAETLPRFVERYLELADAVRGASSPQKRAELERELATLILAQSALDLFVAVHGVLVITLPKELARFSYDIFLVLHEEVVTSLGAVRLLAGCVPGVDEGALCCQGAGLAECMQSVFAAISALYERARRDDIGYFRNFVEHHRGLEHTGGVEKGGTFILACDRHGVEESVVADFSLAGCVPCCCPPERVDVCLPPIALLDCVVVTPTPLGERVEPVEILIDVQSNDSNPNLEHEAREYSLEIALDDPPLTLLGAEVEVVDNGVVRYRLEDPVPGTLDIFPYSVNLDSKECRGADRGHVLVLFKPEAVEEKPQSKTGTIRGIVMFDNRPAPFANLELNGVPLPTVIVDDGGRFEIPNLPAGSYTLKASAEGGFLESSEVVVDVPSEAAENVVLRLVAQQLGNLLVIVLDSGSLTNNAVVTINDARGNVRIAERLGEGRYSASNLSAGPATVRANLINHVPKFLRLDIVAGQQVEARIGFTGPIIPPIGVLTRVADATNVSEDEARTVVIDLIEARHEPRAASIRVAADTANIGDAASVTDAETFIETVLTKPDLGEAELIAEFQRVSKKLATSIRRSGATKKEGFRRVLEATSHAFLDRLAMENPGGVSPEAEEAVTAMAKTVKDAGVPLAEFKRNWNGAEIDGTLRTTSAQPMIRMIE